VGKESLCKKKSLSVLSDENIPIDYKDPKLLKHFITERGKIMPRRMDGYVR